MRGAGFGPFGRDEVVHIVAFGGLAEALPQDAVGLEVMVPLIATRAEFDLV